MKAPAEVSRKGSPAPMRPTFFRTPAAFRRWLEKNHGRCEELWVGFYKKASGKGGLTYPEALDEALCFGWIDGVRKRLDDVAFVQRFTPRRPRSYWSAVNIHRVAELQKAGRMAPAGIAAFERRTKATPIRYSFERTAPATLAPEFEAKFRQNAEAWSYFEREAPWYRRVALHWVISAKREDTRRRRLEMLIKDCAAGRRIGTVPPRSSK
jgi:uncharacterized protein YdeI (YjbR/CyaY-like superfamily)